MLHYLEAMFRQMDVSSLLDAAARVAAVRRRELESIARLTTENARRFFRIEVEP